MLQYEMAAYWVGILCVAAASILATFGLIWRREKSLVRAWWAGLAGSVALAAAIGIRWVGAGHFPYITPYENVLVGAFSMVVGYLLISLRWTNLRVAGALVLPVTLLSLGFGLTQDITRGPLTPPFQSSWLVIHVTFAWVTYSAYTVVAGFALALLLRERARRKGTEAKLPSWIPEGERLDDLSLKLVAFGFLNNGVMIASGAIWAYRLWGKYWSWDPVETWSLLTWLAYGLYLHARLTLGWRGKRLAWLALFALFGVMMTFWGVQLAPTSYHLFKNIGSGKLGTTTSRPL